MSAEDAFRNHPGKQPDGSVRIPTRAGAVRLRSVKMRPDIHRGPNTTCIEVFLGERAADPHFRLFGIPDSEPEPLEAIATIIAETIRSPEFNKQRQERI